MPPATGPADSAGIVMNHAKVEPDSVNGIVNSPIITAPPRPSTPVTFIGTPTNKTGCRPKSSPLDYTAPSRPSGTAVYAGADAGTNV